MSEKFTPRLTKPNAGNPYYNTVGNGGYSTAIKGKPTDAGCDVLHNCVGYAVGRFNEIGAWGACKYLRPVNAENFIQYGGGLEVGQTPRVGACAVWRKGPTLSGSDGAGHVAIVEQVISPTRIVTSESGYGAKNAFWTQTRDKGSGNWGQSSGYTFLGFIYNPAPCCTADDDAPAAEPMTVGSVEQFTGGPIYTSSKSTFAAVVAAAGPVTITHTAPGAPHPFHVVHTGSETTAYGWTDAACLLHKEAEPEPATVKPTTFTVGPVTGSDVARVREALAPVVAELELGRVYTESTDG